MLRIYIVENVNIFYVVLRRHNYKIQNIFYKLLLSTNKIIIDKVSSTTKLLIYF